MFALHRSLRAIVVLTLLAGALVASASQPSPAQASHLLNVEDIDVRPGLDVKPETIEYWTHSKVSCGDRFDVLVHLKTAPGHTLQFTYFTLRSDGPPNFDVTDDLIGCILRNADLALYRAKAAGKARWALFEASMERDAVDVRTSRVTRRELQQRASPAYGAAETTREG